LIDKVLITGQEMNFKPKGEMEMGTKTGTGLIIWLMALVLAVPIRLAAQIREGTVSTGENIIYSQKQLDRLLAPIALYPDILLSQILMASTYPLEVVEADRWLKQRPGLSGNEPDEALTEMPWDISVKSLCRFPKVLDMMSRKLEDTVDLGNAFLNQKDQVMNTIQKLRDRARAAGHLSPSDKEEVIVEDQYISIEPVNPEVVYLPAYDPCTVYGAWWYPECSPLWFWWPDLVVGDGFWWGPPIFIGRLHGWCGFNWPRHDIFIHPARVTFLGGVGITRLHGGMETWHHAPIHRRGVPYPGPETARRFGQVPRPGVEARRQFRGFPHPEGIQGRRSPISPIPGPIERGRPEGLRPPEIQRPIRPETRVPEAPRPFGESRSMVQPQFRQPRMVSPFEGFGRSGPEVRQNSQRGFQSLGRGFREGGRPSERFREGGGPGRGLEGGLRQGGGSNGRGNFEGGRRR
jgi:Protein of unknown function (DUF3300)